MNRREDHVGLQDIMKSQSSSAKKQSKKKDEISLTSLLNFQYDRPNNNDSFEKHTQTRKIRSKLRSYSLSKAQFIQANFKFIVSPLAHPTELCFHDPDEIAPWEYIARVLIPTTESNSNITDNQICPICIDKFKIPKITKCGHVYCVTCILRHIGCDRSNRLKCPMCKENICANDLRTADFIQAYPWYNKLSEIVLDTKQPSSESVGKGITLHHMQLVKGSLYPTRWITSEQSIHHEMIQTTSSFTSSPPCSTLSSLLLPHTQSTDILDFPPGIRSIHAPYARILQYTYEDMIHHFEHERNDLIQFRQVCLHSHDGFEASGDVEYLPIIQDALELLEKNQKEFNCQWERHQNDSKGVKKKCENESETPLGKSIITPKEIQMMKSTQESYEFSETLPDPDGGVEADPPDLPMNGNIYHFYQISDGELVYLHPLCNRFLMDHFGGDPRNLPDQIQLDHFVDIEKFRILSTNRSKVPFLRFLPEHCEVILIEMDLMLNPSDPLCGRLISNEVMCSFQNELIKRKQKRQLNKKKEIKAQQELDFKMRLDNEIMKSKVEQLYIERDREEKQLQELLNGPTLAEAVGIISSSPPIGNQMHLDGIPLESPKEENFSTNKKMNFSLVTKMGGDFPTLYESIESKGSSIPHSNLTLSLHQSKANPIEEKCVVPVNASVWGNKHTPIRTNPLKKDGPPHTDTAVLVKEPPVLVGSPVLTNSLVGITATGHHKKTKISLMSNASARSYR